MKFLSVMLSLFGSLLLVAEEVQIPTVRCTIVHDQLKPSLLSVDKFEEKFTNCKTQSIRTICTLKKIIFLDNYGKDMSVSIRYASLIGYGASMSLDVLNTDETSYSLSGASGDFPISVGGNMRMVDSNGHRIKVACIADIVAKDYGTDYNDSTVFKLRDKISVIDNINMPKALESLKWKLLMILESNPPIYRYVLVKDK